MKKILTLLTLFLVIVSCASPTVVNVIGPNDSKRIVLSNEIFKANKYGNLLFSKKTGEPHNIRYSSFYQVMELH